MKVPSSPRKRYLGGADWCVAALRHGTLATSGRPSSFHVAVFVAGHPDPALLQDRFQDFCARFPLLWGRVARCWCLAPYWKSPAETGGRKAPFRLVADFGAATADNVVRWTEGLANDAVAIDRDVPGTVVAADVADLDADGSPEVYIHVGASARNGRAALVAYSANRGKSLSDIYLPALEDGQGAAIGFVGPEEMAVVDASLVRRFPVEGGRIRQLQYRLHAGEAGWEFRLERTDEF